jgi:hypothetical protein
VHRPRRRRGGASTPPAHGPRGPRWRRLHQPRPRRPRCAAAAPARGSHGRADVAPNPRDARSGGVSISRARAGPPRSRRPGERRRHPPPPAGAAARPGVADSDRSQSQDGPLASGPKVLSSSVCEGLLGRARRRTESLVETCGEGGSRPHLYRARRRTESLVETCGEGGSRPRWAAPDVAPSPLWTRAMKGAAAGACSGLVLLLHSGLGRTQSRTESRVDRGN